MFYAHISGMDALARGLRSVARLQGAGLLQALREERYASWRAKGGIGAKISAGKARGVCVSPSVPLPAAAARRPSLP